MSTMISRVRRTSQQTTLRAVGLYAQGLGLRGTMTRAEVRGMRLLLEAQLGRTAFRADPQTQLESVRATHEDGQVRGEWVQRPGVATRDTAVILYVHGGAFISGSVKSHRGLTSELARRTERSVFSLDYRLAPEYRFPAAADDVLRAYAWLLDTGVPAGGIVIAGDSAGGHLALGLLPRAKRAGLPLPAGALAFSPLIDPSMQLSGEWERTQLRRRPAIDARAGRAAVRLYHPGVPADHRELLLTGDDLSGLPPVLVQASAAEPLVADAQHYVAALREAGGRVELQTWPRQMHVFQVAFRISRSADEALTRATEFVASVSPARTRSPTL